MKPLVRRLQQAFVSTFLITSSAAAAAADGCGDFTDVTPFSVCRMATTASKFSLSSENKEHWEDARVYAQTAIGGINYLVERFADDPQYQQVISELIAEREVLQVRRANCEQKMTAKREAEEKRIQKEEAEEERRRQVLVNLFRPSSPLNVYVNRRWVGDEQVYVPPGPIHLGIAWPGGRYDEAVLSNPSKVLSLKLVGVESSPDPDPAALGRGSLAFDLASGPLLGARQAIGSSRRWDLSVGLRNEVTFPDLILGEYGRLRPMIDYVFEQMIPNEPEKSNDGWTVHGLGAGLKLSVAEILDFSAGIHASHVSGSFVENDVERPRRAWGVGPDLGIGVSRTVLNPASMNGPKLGLGVSFRAGVSNWLSRPFSYEDPWTDSAYVSASVFLRLRFGRGRPNSVPVQAEMVHYAGVLFQMGSNDGPEAERPEHYVLLASFQLDKREVSVADYRVCVDSGKCTAPSSAPNCNWNARGRRGHPINCVSHEQASAYCRFVGKRLPAESEWEHAARGGLRRAYPWGNGQPPSNQVCWSGRGREMGSTCETGSSADDKTPEGVLDLGGNVAEWTGQYCNYPKAACKSNKWVSRGGSYAHSELNQLRAGARSVPLAESLDTVGFRCAR